MFKANSVRIFLDLGMLVLLPFALAFRITGATLHELIGITALILFGAHNFLNLRWYRGIFKGKYATARATNSLVNIALATTAISMFFSGLLISKYSPVFFDNQTEMKLRQIHSICGYWTFLLAGVHIGFHFVKMRSSYGIFKFKPRKIFKIISLFLLAFGVWSWIKRGFFEKLFMGYSFDFFDCQSSSTLWIAQNCAIIWLVAFVANLICNIKGKNKIDKTKDII